MKNIEIFNDESINISVYEYENKIYLGAYDKENHFSRHYDLSNKYEGVKCMVDFQLQDKKIDETAWKFIMDMCCWDYDTAKIIFTWESDKVEYEQEQMMIEKQKLERDENLPF